jgi:protein O-GlcNAc transferase
MPELTVDQAFQLALQHHQAGRLDEAEPIYRKIIEVSPEHSDAIHLLGMTAFQRGKAEVALELVRRAIALRPGVAIYHNNLGQTLERLGRRDEIAAEYRKALALDPNYAEAHNNLANVLEREDKLAEAIAGYRTAIRLKPDYAEAYANLGNVFKEQGNLDEAIDCCRAAVARMPELSLLHSNLLLSLHYSLRYSPADLVREHRAWAERHVAPLRSSIQPHSNDRDPSRPLRIGYVSSDLRHHVVGRNVYPLFAHHDHSQFEVFAYSNSTTHDGLSEDLKSKCAGWRAIAGRSDDEVTRTLRADRIDILVDLNLHTTGHRLEIFARKPAPVQVTFAGYPGTTGVETIDYRLTDPFLDPPGEHDDHYAEGSYRLPHSFWCYHPLTPTPEVGPPPHLHNGRITFGCLNNFCKVSNVILRLWARILVGVPGSVIHIRCRPGSHRAVFQEEFARHGGDPARIQFIGQMKHDEYLRHHHQLDIILDTYPYTGHTTSCDALWMGVPVVSLAGDTAVSRGGLSLLSNVGLPELVATREEDYVAIAIGLARDGAPRLAELRSSMRARMKSSPLMDAPKWAGGIENAFRTMWQRWCARPPS